MSSKTDMLGDFLRKLVELPSEVLGLVCDLLGKLHDPVWVEALKRFLRKEESWPIFPQYPADGVEFVLTLDGDAPENDHIEMVRSAGYCSPEKWRFNGRKVVGVQTRRFKLVRVCFCRNLDEVREKLAQYGEIPDGQWLEAFKAAYPKPDGNGPIGIADASWNLSGIAYFPSVYSGGKSRFFWAISGHGEGWRWLVPAGKPS